MKFEVGDIFVDANIVGLLVSIREGHTYAYYIDWSGGTKGHYKEYEILNWIKEEKIIHYPVK